MITNVKMERIICDGVVEQRTKDGYFNATSLLNIFLRDDSSPKKMMAHFFENKDTKRYLIALANDINIDNNDNIAFPIFVKNEDGLIISINNKNNMVSPNDLYISSRGKGGGTWMHPFLFIKFAMWLSPEFEVQVTKWIADGLIHVRREASNGYKDMIKAITRYHLRLDGCMPTKDDYSKEAMLINYAFTEKEGEKPDRQKLGEVDLKLLRELEMLNTELLDEHEDFESRKEELIKYKKRFIRYNKR